MGTPAGPSVVVIGGGVIGLSVAWRAAQRGLQVTVADPDPGKGASYAAAGMITPVSEAAYAERELYQLGAAAQQQYAAFAAELTAATGLPTGYRQAGTLQVAWDSDDLAVLGEFRALQESFGVTVQPLTGRECRTAEPMLGPSVRGGLLVPDDASVDPRLLTSALLMAATGAGVRLIRSAAVEVTVTAGRAAGAVLADGTGLRADWVVLAAGWRSGSVAGLPPDAIPPVRPVKGQILRLRPGPGGPAPGGPAPGGPPGLLSRTVRGVVQGSSVYLVPRESGELVIGATQEEMGSDTRVTAGGVWELLRDARAIVPGITELELAEAVAGLRPGTPDNAPVLGPAGLPGLVLATGHFRAGVLLAPVTADLISGYLATGELDERAAPFGPGRFSPVRQEARR
ncbi:MAG TPA: glycine oxidase ThiO [Streptosporangiaceae bacterium]